MSDLIRPLGDICPCWVGGPSGKPVPDGLDRSTPGGPGLLRLRNVVPGTLFLCRLPFSGGISGEPPGERGAFLYVKRDHLSQLPAPRPAAHRSATGHGPAGRPVLRPSIRAAEGGGFHRDQGKVHLRLLPTKSIPDVWQAGRGGGRPA